MRLKVFCIPILTIISLTLIAVFLQSCGIARVDSIRAPRIIREFKLDAALWVLGLTIAIGSGFGLFIYRKITVLEDRINQLNQSE